MAVDIKIVELSFKGSLYDPAADEFLSELEEILSASTQQMVVIRSSIECHDYHSSWLDRLHSSLFWEDLLAHFERIFLIFYRIANSQNRWFFVSSMDCLGSWWDLALACHGRVFTIPYAKVGYPEFYIDLFPPLGALALKKFQAYENIQACKKNAILHVKDAYELELIHLVLQGEQWISNEGLDFLKSWFVVGRVQSFEKGQWMDSSPSLTETIDLRTKHLTRRKQVGDCKLSVGIDSLMDRSIFHRAKSLASIRAGAAARFLFEDYSSWLSRRVARYQFGSRDRWWDQSDGVVVFNLDHNGLPPQSVLEALLNRKLHMILLSETEDRLKDSVETLISRSHRRGISRKDVLSSWRGQVEWRVGRASESESLWISFAANDQMLIGLKDQVILKTYRFSGNYGSSPLGWTEMLYVGDPSTTFYSAALEFAEILSNGILVSRQLSPLGVGLRYLIIGEMMRLAASGQWPEPVEQSKLFAESGWGFPADAIRLEGFLKSYHLTPEIQEFCLKLGYPVERSSMESLRAQVYPKGHVSKLEMSASRFSRHFQGISVILSERLIDLQIVESQMAADLFLSLSWGYPGTIHLPSVLGGRLGSGRVDQWASF